MKRIIFLLIIQLLFIGMYLGQSFAQTTQATAVQSAAGGSAQNSSHTLFATIGQSSPPKSATNGQHTLYSGFIYTLADALSIDDTTGTPNVNEALRIVATISPQQNVDKAQVYYRKGGEQNFLVQTMTPENENYVCSIPGSDMTSRGIEFYIVAEDIDGNTTRSPNSGVAALQVNVADPGARNPAAQPAGSAQTAYRLVSFPLDLTNKGPASVVSDDLGGYDRTKWRFFELRDGKPPYYEFPDITDIKPGEGFWLIVKSSGKFLDTGAGKTIVTNQIFTIALDTGWTFIGNPFDYPIPLNHLSLISNQLLDIRNYEGTWKSVTDFIQPFEGYAIANNSNSSDILNIDPYLYPVTGTVEKVLAATQETDLLWSITVKAQCQEALDLDNIAAVAELASIDWDKLDRPEPPVIGEYVSVAFPHQEWDKPLKSYCTDVRPEPVTGEIWQFEVRTNINDPVKLSFEGLDTVPLQFEVWLIDEVAKITQNLRDNNSHSVAVSDEAHPRQLKLVVGSHDFIGLELSEFQVMPERYELHQNFPNPFNPTTTIRYGLPIAENVTLKIFNLLGEEVVTLVSNEKQQAGFHVAIWDGKNQQGQVVANGIYMYQLQIGKFSVTKKMAMMK